MNLIRHFHYGNKTPTKAERNIMVGCGTVAIVNCPTNLQLILHSQSQLNGLAPLLLLNIGIARLHPDDNYNKKIGAKVATDKAQTSRFFSLDINSRHVLGASDTYMLLTSKDEGPDTSVRLKIDYGSEYPSIISFTYFDKDHFLLRM